MCSIGFFHSLLFQIIDLFYLKITITGIMSSKMQVFIYDCDLLPDDVLENCNIMTEKNKDRFIWKPSFDYIKCKSN